MVTVKRGWLRDAIAGRRDYPIGMGTRGTRRPRRLVVAVVVVLATTAWAPQQGGAPVFNEQAGFGDRPSLPPGLHRLVAYDDLRAVRTFFERVDVTETAEDVRRPRANGDGLATVARGLDDRWEAPFEFVRGAITFAPYDGSVRGAAGALIAGAANALDQALLLRALLEIRGVSVRLVRGQLDWPDAARLVLGGEPSGSPQRGDPWPRWVESAADHWWVQAQQDGLWVDLDPSFFDAQQGEARATAAQVSSGVPAEMTTRVRVELRRGDQVVAGADYDGAAIVGQSVNVRLVALAAIPIELWIDANDAMERWSTELRGLLESLGFVPRRRPVTDVDGLPGAIDRANASPADAPARQRVVRRIRPVTEVRSAPAATALAVVRRNYFVPEIPEDAGPWMATLIVPGQVLEAGPFEVADLALLQLRMSVAAPLAPEQVLQIPWGEGGRGGITVVVGAGRVGDARLSAVAAPVYSSLIALASIEANALDAMRPPVEYYRAVESLRSAAVNTWMEFSDAAPTALAWAVLRGVDRVSGGNAAGRVVRQGLRLAAVRWRPPGEANEGTLALLLHDPITIGQLTGVASSVDLRAGYGLLQSAVLSQILNRIADRAPQTAFDMTLRSIGTGSEIVGFREGEDPPDTWPVVARAATASRTRAGYAIMGPETPEDGFMGWWQVGLADGEITGWVSGAAGDIQGLVHVGAPVRADALDTLLASLPALHRAARWLADLTGDGSAGLSAVPAAACASAAVAADPMAAGLPPGWPRAEVLALCLPD